MVRISREDVQYTRDKLDIISVLVNHFKYVRNFIIICIPISFLSQSVRIILHLLFHLFSTVWNDLSNFFAASIMNSFELNLSCISLLDICLREDSKFSMIRVILPKDSSWLSLTLFASLTLFPVSSILKEYRIDVHSFSSCAHLLYLCKNSGSTRAEDFLQLFPRSFTLLIDACVIFDTLSVKI